MKTIRNTKLFLELQEKPDWKTLWSYNGTTPILKDDNIPYLLGGIDHIEVKPRGVYFYDRGNNNVSNNFVIRPELIKKHRITPKEIIELVRKLPDVENHIFECGDKKFITQEWLCGSFTGCAFMGDTFEEAAEKMIEYLYQHMGHDSIVGHIVTKSGFPDLKKVEQFCKRLNKENM